MSTQGTVPAAWAAQSAPDGVVVAATPDAAPDDLPAAVELLGTELDGPVVVRTCSAEVLSACLDAGAAAAHDPRGEGGPEYLAAAQSAGAGVILGSPRPGGLGAVVDQLTAAGFGPERIAVDVTSGAVGAGPAVARIDEVAAAASRGVAVLVDVGPEGSAPEDDPRAAAAHTVLAAAGARLLVGRDVRATRRVAAVVAELLRAHTETRPDPERMP